MATTTTTRTTNDTSGAEHSVLPHAYRNAQLKSYCGTCGADEFCSMGSCQCMGGNRETSCLDGEDNDCDNLVDCMDDDCIFTILLSQFLGADQFAALVQGSFFQETMNRLG